MQVHYVRLVWVLVLWVVVGCVREAATSTSKATASSSPSGTTSSTVTASYTNPIRKSEIGDRIQDFQLVERIQSLGHRKEQLQHQSRYHWQHHDASLPSTTTSYPLLSSTADSTSSSSSSTSSELASTSTPPHTTNHSHCLYNTTFCMEENIFHGGHGDIWRAYRIDNTTGNILQDELYVMKRMLLYKRPDILGCALREIYFGTFLQTRSSFPRFITSFYLPEQHEYWLIYRYEGSSLQKMIYAIEHQVASTIVLKPSMIWKRLRTTKSGMTSLKGIMFQLISNVAELHQLGIVHRDIKPSNILLNMELKPKLMIADFSSAIHDEILPQEQYFPKHGPSIQEETLAYAPPEVLLSIPADVEEGMTEGRRNKGDSGGMKGEDSTNEETETLVQGIPYDTRRPESYDIWSVGVVFLELLLGTSDIFNVDQRTVSMIKQRLKKRGMDHPTLLKNALLLASYADYCIYQQEHRAEDSNGEDDQFQASGTAASSSGGANSKAAKRRKRSERLSDTVLDMISSYAQDGTSFNLLPLAASVSSSSTLKEFPNTRSLTQQCSIRELAEAILRRDPLGIGFGDRWGLDLLQRLLQFDPMKRINMSEAIKHAYFQGPYQSVHDQQAFATEEERNLYDLKVNKTATSVTKSSTSSALSTYHSNDLPLGTLFDDIDVKSSAWLDDVVDETTATSTTVTVDEDNTTIMDEEGAEISFFDELPIDLLIDSMIFTCSTCQRKFKGNWQSCQKHSTLRKHGLQCRYDAPEISSDWQDDIQDVIYRHNEQVLDAAFPPCLSDHFLLPLDPHSGWCDLRGRRKYIEDYHAIYFEDKYKYFGVFDGHLGSFAARFAAYEIFRLFQVTMTSMTSKDCEIEAACTSVGTVASSSTTAGSADDAMEEDMDITTKLRLDKINAKTSHWQHMIQLQSQDSNIALSHDGQVVSVRDIMKSMKSAFLKTDIALTQYEHQARYETVGGTTATIVMLFESQDIFIASVGDSRAILCCQFTIDSHEDNHVDVVVPIQLTLDHTPVDKDEYHHIYQRGGYVDQSSTIPRVNGKLAVTRSLGDNAYGQLLSPEPDVFMFRIQHKPVLTSTWNLPTSVPQATKCKVLLHMLQDYYDVIKDYPGLFLIIGSDGLWDVMTNVEASNMVCGYLLEVLQEQNSIASEDHHRPASLKDVEPIPLLPSDTFQRVSKLLAHEALLRGSSDNIGVCVLDLFSKNLFVK